MAGPDAWIDTPKITALSDAPVLKGDIGEGDHFQLSRSMGPVLDILRHKDTQTPLSVALYGTWGSGKSTAMHWLQAGLEAWNDELPKVNDGQDEDDLWPHAIPVNFYPWKYSTKEDVWRGLIVEIILACIKHNEKGGVAVNEVVSKFAGFLGKKLISALSALKMKGSFAGTEVEVEVEKLVKVFDNHEVSPETAYLNDFEDTFSSWVGQILKPTSHEGQAQKMMRYRLVVFIDDLDRCLPEVALQVLEALKLYLNIPGLVFVLGLDQKVVQQLVCKHYEKLGVSEDKSKHYLAKMFQVEVPLEPHESQIEIYVDQLVSDEQWAKLGINNDNKEKEVFLKVIRELGDYSPRETKRLVNSALMQARGAQFIEHEKNELSPTQAVQIHLIEEVLRRKYPAQDRWLRLRRYQEFFLKWNDPEPLERILSEEGKLNEVEAKLKKDTWLQELMRIPGFPSKNQLESIQVQEVNQDFMSLVEAQTGMPWEELEKDGFKNVTELDLSGKNVEDWSGVSRFKYLEELNLWDSSFDQFEGLSKLDSLRKVDLDGTIISDVRVLEVLEGLEELHVWETAITDVSRIAKLKNLKVLSLPSKAMIENDLLYNMPYLKELYLRGWEGQNLNFLKNASQLTRLVLTGARVNDYNVLSSMRNLQELRLEGSNFNDLSVLHGLSKLQSLALPEKMKGERGIQDITGSNLYLKLFFI